MKNLIGSVFLAVVLIAPAFAIEEQTWVGKISDSDCGAKHMAGSEHQTAMSDPDCVKACIDKGAKYVFVNDGKVLQISNQDFADLRVHAGHEVRLTGEKTGDTIKVTKIEMPKKA
jgi:hypothetical protein